MLIHCQPSQRSNRSLTRVIVSKRYAKEREVIESIEDKAITEMVEMTEAVIPIQAANPTSEAVIPIEAASAIEALRVNLRGSLPSLRPQPVITMPAGRRSRGKHGAHKRR